jgi:hypothetical protein
LGLCFMEMLFRVVPTSSWLRALPGGRRTEDAGSRLGFYRLRAYSESLLVESVWITCVHLCRFSDSGAYGSRPFLSLCAPHCPSSGWLESMVLFFSGFDLVQFLWLRFLLSPSSTSPALFLGAQTEHPPVLRSSSIPTLI